MTNRKENQLQDFLELINKEWNLSLNEQSVLEYTLTWIKERDISKLFDFVENNYENILDRIPNYKIEEYARSEMDMVDEYDCKDISEYSDDAILDEVFERRLDVESYCEHDIVLQLQLEQLQEKFINLNLEEREKLLGWKI